MNYFLILFVLCLLHITAFSNFEGSGDEVSLSFQSEQLIPLIQFRDGINRRYKKQKKNRNKKGFNSSVKSTKGEYGRFKLRYTDPCKLARCSHICRLRNNTAYCSCYKGFQLHSDGKSCKASCSPPCLNNGECIGPNICSCPPGYLQPRCSAVCEPPCANGGICKRHNTCKCPQNYVGRTCLIAICKSGCLNGGQCIAPNVCHCPSNYFGHTCERALCSPPCENDGICVGNNQCLCKSGFEGPRCQNILDGDKKSICNPHCKANKNYLNKEMTCRPTCQNGGLCTLNNKCICPLGAYGPKCQNRRCPIVTFTLNVTRMIRIHVTETYVTNCPQVTERKCTNYRLVTKMVPKTFQKLGYKIRCK